MHKYSKYAIDAEKAKTEAEDLRRKEIAAQETETWNKVWHQTMCVVAKNLLENGMGEFIRQKALEKNSDGYKTDNFIFSTSGGYADDFHLPFTPNPNEEYTQILLQELMENGYDVLILHTRKEHRTVCGDDVEGTGEYYDDYALKVMW